MLGILILAIPLIIYISGALSVARKDVTHPDDFFLAYRKVGVTVFSSSSVAYAFQLSTIYPFLLWGASSFFFVPIVNTVCWGLGILLFYFAFERYKKFIGTDLTLHGFLGAQYGNSVRIVASYLTIIGFLGFAIAELYFGSHVLLSIIENRNLFYLAIFGAVLLVYGYIAYGGQVSSMRTDQLQLAISYIGIFSLVLYFCYLLISQGIRVSGPLTIAFALLLVYIPIVLINRRLSFVSIGNHSSPLGAAVSKALNVAIGIILASISGVAILVLWRDGTLHQSVRFVDLSGFGVPGLISLTILPLCWQFVDLTNWQRLLSVKPDDKTSGSLDRNIRRGLLIYAGESPFTWILFLFFGLLAVTALAHVSFQDVLVDLPRYLIHSAHLAQRVFGYVFIVSLLSIMLSTVDSFMVGIIFTFTYDSFGKTRRLLDRHDDSEVRAQYGSIINAGRIFGLFALAAGLSLFVFFDKHIPSGGELFINLLLAFYSAQLSFFPLVFGILFLGHHPSSKWAVATILTGAVAGISLGIYSVIWSPQLAWYPLIVCFIVSELVYWAGYISTRSRRRDETELVGVSVEKG